MKHLRRNIKIEAKPCDIDHKMVGSELKLNKCDPKNGPRIRVQTDMDTPHRIRFRIQFVNADIHMLYSFRK